MKQIHATFPALREVAEAARLDIEEMQHNAGRPFGVPTPVQTSDCSAKLGQLVLCRPGEGQITVTLPKLTAQDVGKMVCVCNMSTSLKAVNVRGAAGATIDGDDSYPLVTWLGVSFVAISSTEWIGI